MANLQGIDVSTWQGEMNWEIASNVEAKFAIIRAGSINNDTGKCYMDYQFIRNATLAPDYLPIGCYWYFRPNHDPVKQAEYYWDLIKDENWVIPPVADVETNGGLQPAAYADSLKAFLDELESKLSIVPIIYSSSYKFSQVEPRPYWSDYDLWVAHYTEGPSPLLPEAWKDWRFWQYSSKGIGPHYGAESAFIDLDYFNGDQQAFDEYIGKKPPSTNVPELLNVTVEWNGVLYKGEVKR